MHAQCFIRINEIAGKNLKYASCGFTIRLTYNPVFFLPSEKES